MLSRGDCALEELDLGANGLPPDVTHALVSAVGASRLRVLELFGNEMAEDTVALAEEMRGAGTCDVAWDRKPDHDG